MLFGSGWKTSSALAVSAAGVLVRNVALLAVLPCAHAHHHVNQPDLTGPVQLLLYHRKTLILRLGRTAGQHSQAARVCHGVTQLIGNTPLVLIESLSKETGCLIYGKAEFLNPGGSVKDRVALQIVQEAWESGRLQPGGLITEGTAGSTGVSLAMASCDDELHGCAFA